DDLENVVEEQMTNWLRFSNWLKPSSRRQRRATQTTSPLRIRGNVAVRGCCSREQEQ
ncbi:hypothetical protein EC968_009340, partial [Mortierella alpina]